MKGIGILLVAAALSLCRFVIPSHAGWTPVAPPDVSSNWSLEGVGFMSPDEGWALGEDTSNRRGVLLHYSNGTWASVLPPSVSSNWYLTGVHFPSFLSMGWAVGTDVVNGRGILLQYNGGAWTPVTPPAVSFNWGLESVHFPVTGEGWAVGRDEQYSRGVLLHYTNLSWSAVSPPSVSSNWTLDDVYFSSTLEGWAAGTDLANKKGVLVHYSNGSWSIVGPPTVSSDWKLAGRCLAFASPTEGWAVGDDREHKRGVLLHYLNGSWMNVSPPSVSSDWSLSAVHFNSPGVGWAAGYDHDNQRGVFLQYGNGSWAVVSPPVLSQAWEPLDIHITSLGEVWVVGEISSSPDKKGLLLTYVHETLSVPSAPTGPSGGSSGVFYSFTTGNSVSSLEHPLEYQFDWKGDATDLSPWDVATFYGVNWNFSEQDKRWNAPGTYLVRARARCIKHPDFVSSWSEPLTVNIAGAPENITPPAAPVGPAQGGRGTTYTFSVKGAASDLGHSVQYFVDWGDGSNSDWLPVGQTSATKSWPILGSFIVRAKARCATDTSFESDWSPGLTVAISDIGPDLTASWTVPLSQTCRTTRQGLKCSLKGTLKVVNVGNKDADSTTAEFFLSLDSHHGGSDILLKSFTTGKLKPGKSKTIRLNLNLPTNQTAKDQYVFTVIDRNNTVAELNESNNLVTAGPVP